MVTEYLVVLREKQWWVMVDGLRRGPYVSRQIAMDGALVLARLDFKAGRGAAIAVENGDSFDQIYRSD